MIRGIPDGRIEPGHVAELGEWPRELRVAGTHERGRNLIGAEIVGSEVAGHVAHISDLDEQVPRRFALHAEIVLVRNGSDLLGIEERNGGVGLLAERHGAETRRERLAHVGGESVAEQEGALGLGLCHRITRCSRKSQRSYVADTVAYGGSVKEACAAANHSVTVSGYTP